MELVRRATAGGGGVAGAVAEADGPGAGRGDGGVNAMGVDLDGFCITSFMQ